MEQTGHFYNSRACSATDSHETYRSSAMRSLFFLFINLVTATQDGYDYIIVGGGTGGLVVANRLFENPGVPVLIVKAGASVPDNKNVTNIDRYAAAFNTRR
ncbi:hypothetical protein N8T08_010506 [Aspergillus melleus]|uniref:Uncharacterized protein n=1 Tax=Aspergillus melleus TaxID=138277 RepID=A0ACC3ARC6_9EURO|nr:hypothetical protein N8T08_010506 [Aspergillus melleus]